MTKEAIHEWLNVGFLAPSGDNIQPWVITFPNDNTIVLTLDFTKEHILDRMKKASLISLGCFFECLVQSSEHFGIKIESSIFQDKSLTLTIIPQDKNDSSVSIFKIKSRVSDRGDYDNLTDTSSLKAIIAKEENVVFYHDIPDKILSRWTDFEYGIWKNTPLMEDLLDWVRITRPQNTPLGLSVYSLGISLGEIFGFYILKAVKAIGISLKYFVAKPQISNRFKKMIANSSGFIFFWESKLDDDAIFNLGRKIQRVWMELNYTNISAQPMTIQSLLISELSHYNELSKYFPKESITHANEILQNMQALKENSCVSFPAFILRVGKTRKIVPPHSREFLK